LLWKSTLALTLCPPFLADPIHTPLSSFFSAPGTGAAGLLGDLTAGVWPTRERTGGSSLERGTNERGLSSLLGDGHVLLRRNSMNGIIYLVGLIVVIMFILSFLGLR